MISAPWTGCVRPRRDSSASAGGQLEQPSDVNNSTRTGVDARSGSLEVAGICFIPAATGPITAGHRVIRARSTAAMNIVRANDRRLIELILRTPPHNRHFLF